MAINATSSELKKLFNYHKEIDSLTTEMHELQSKISELKRQRNDLINSIHRKFYLELEKLSPDQWESKHVSWLLSRSITDEIRSMKDSIFNKIDIDKLEYNEVNQSTLIVHSKKQFVWIIKNFDIIKQGWHPIAYEREMNCYEIMVVVKNNLYRIQFSSDGKEIRCRDEWMRLDKELINNFPDFLEN